MNDDQNNSVSLLINHLLPLPSIWVRLVREIHKVVVVVMEVAMAALMTPPCPMCPSPFQVGRAKACGEKNL